MASQPQLPTSKYFHLQQIHEGIYAAFATDEGGGSNAGIIDLGDRTLIFDTFLTPQAATDLRRAAEALTGRAVGMVVNSHFHEGHTWGNQAFDPATDIVSTSLARQLFSARAPQALAFYQAHAQRELQKLEESQKKATNKYEARQAQLAISHYQALVTALPSYKLRAPNLTFGQHLVVHGAARSAELISYGSGHTESDALLFIRNAGVLFMGDLLTIKRHPYLVDGDPGELPRILDTIRLLQPQILVPGHGGIGSMQDVELMQHYLSMLTETALEQLTFRLESPDQLEPTLQRLRVPEPFRDWESSAFFTDNLRFLHHRLMKAYADE